MSPATPHKTINRHLDSVALALHFDIIEPPTTPLPPLQALSQPPQNNFTSTVAEVSLTINFYSNQTIAIPVGERLGLPKGEVRFGFRRGRLQFFLDQCTIPWTNNGLGQSRNAPSAIENNADMIYVERQGTEASPLWIFEARGRQKTLEGKFTTAFLGHLTGPLKSCHVMARFMVEPEDIRLDWGDWPSYKQISQNKLAVIQSVLAYEYIKPHIDSCRLSEVSWRYKQDTSLAH